MNTNLSIIILAAGKGTRMFSDKPKVIHEVAGRPMLEYVLETANDLCPDKVIVVTPKDNSEIKDILKKQNSKIYIATQHKPLGTGDAVKQALPMIDVSDGLTLVLYGDTPLITVKTLKLAINKFNDPKIATVVVGFHTKNLDAEYGRLITNNVKLEAIVEFNEANLKQKNIDFCNSGMMVINNKYLINLISHINNANSKNEYYLTDIISIAKKNRLECLFVTGDEQEVLGINNKTQLSIVEKIIQNRIREQALANGVKLLDPESVYFSHDTKLGKDVTIEPYVFFGTNVEIEDNVVVRAFSHIENAKIKKNAIIGPLTRISDQAVIEENAIIKNFMEVKNTIVKNNSHNDILLKKEKEKC